MKSKVQAVRTSKKITKKLTIKTGVRAGRFAIREGGKTVGAG